MKQLSLLLCEQIWWLSYTLVMVIVMVMVGKYLYNVTQKMLHYSVLMHNRKN